MAKPARSELAEGVEIVITPKRVGDDSQITIYGVVIEKVGPQIMGGTVSDTFGSKELLETYLRGVAAGARIFAGKLVRKPEVPVNGNGS